MAATLQPKTVKFDTTDLQSRLQTQIKPLPQEKKGSEISAIRKQLSSISKGVSGEIKTGAQDLGKNLQEQAKQKAEEAKKEAQRIKKEAEDAKKKAKETIKKAEDLAARLKGFQIPRLPDVPKIKIKDLFVPNKIKKQESDFKKLQKFVDDAKSSANKFQTELADFKKQGMDVYNSAKNNVESAKGLVQQSIGTATGFAQGAIGDLQSVQGQIQGAASQIADNAQSTIQQSLISSLRNNTIESQKASEQQKEQSQQTEQTQTE